MWRNYPKELHQENHTIPENQGIQGIQEIQGNLETRKFQEILNIVGGLSPQSENT